MTTDSTQPPQTSLARAAATATSSNDPPELAARDDASASSAELSADLQAENNNNDNVSTNDPLDDPRFASQTDQRSCTNRIHMQEMESLFTAVPPQHQSDLLDLYQHSTPMHSVRKKANTWISRAPEGSSEPPPDPSI